jgi:hypothetical protein
VVHAGQRIRDDLLDQGSEILAAERAERSAVSGWWWSRVLASIAGIGVPSWSGLDREPTIDAVADWSAARAGGAAIARRLGAGEGAYETLTSLSERELASSR